MALNIEDISVVIFAGGLGTRLSEETIRRPKPMVEIGTKPILHHIMDSYAKYGFKRFVVCCGYKGYMIKEYFANYFLHNSDVTISLADNSVDYIKSKSLDWKVTLIDTGLETMTGGRLKAVQNYVGETFCLTYGDGLSDVNLSDLLHFHQSHGKAATVTGVRPPGRFGSLKITDNLVTSFQEKPEGDGTWINGGFFVLEKSVMKYLTKPSDVWEQEPLKRLSADEQLAVFKHKGF